NGKVLSQGRGGKIIKLPLVDEIIVIPTTTRKTLLNSNEKILSREYQNVKISAILYWRVSDPGVAFSAVVWDRRSEDYVEFVLSTATEAIIRTTCASLPIESILRDRN
ncbi:MAG: SPFH domain-containing protein, partial [Promethearchaeota archaeon]